MRFIPFLQARTWACPVNMCSHRARPLPPSGAAVIPSDLPSAGPGHRARKLSPPTLTSNTHVTSPAQSGVSESRCPHPDSTATLSPQGSLPVEPMGPCGASEAFFGLFVAGLPASWRRHRRGSSGPLQGPFCYCKSSPGLRQLCLLTAMQPPVVVPNEGAIHMLGLDWEERVLKAP